MKNMNSMKKMKMKLKEKIKIRVTEIEKNDGGADEEVTVFTNLTA